MNGAKKFHSPDGPAFNPGEIWEAVGGNRAEIKAVKRWGVDNWDVDVYYTDPDSNLDIGMRKNAWAFQVRYQHQADKEI